MKIFLQALFLSLLIPFSAKAEWGFEVQGVYLSTSQEASLDTEGTSLLWQTAFSVDVTKQLFMGWSYGALSVTEKVDSTENQLEIQDMGLFVRYYLTRSKDFSVYFVYNILSTAQQSDGSEEGELTGTSYLAGLSILPEVRENLRLGLQINYYNADFTSKTVDSTKEDVSYNKNLIIPAIVMVKTF